jgi:beta-glucosidase
MAEARFTFPRGFLWGAATAAHQVEGGNTNNNWFAWELGGRVHPGHHAGLACDWWGGRWQEDLDRAAEAGQNAHRFSVEWSRIEPEPGKWDADALAFYVALARGVRARGMTPMVTLHHFTDPLWLYERGGWEKDVSEAFGRFVEKVVGALQDDVRLWVTLNEPNVYTTMGYVLGAFPPGRKSLSAAARVTANLAKGHAAAYHNIHRLQPQARVGMAIHYRGMEPARGWMPFDRAVTGYQSRLFNDSFPGVAVSGRVGTPLGRVRVPHGRGTLDFVGVNYFTEELVRFAPFAAGEVFARRYFREGAPLSETGFIAHEPEGLYRALRWAAQFGKPIFVTENGVEDAPDTLRPRYIIEHIRQLWRAVNFNWKIEGYFHWSLVDNFEWERGWTQRFGLWELDVETQARRKRGSADVYAEICRENALTSGTVARHVPELFGAMFPNE